MDREKIKKLVFELDKKVLDMLQFVRLDNPLVIKSVIEVSESMKTLQAALEITVEEQRAHLEGMLEQVESEQKQCNCPLCTIRRKIESGEVDVTVINLKDLVGEDVVIETLTKGKDKRTH